MFTFSGSIRGRRKGFEFKMSRDLKTESIKYRKIIILEKRVRHCLRRGHSSSNIRSRECAGSMFLTLAKLSI